MKKNRFIKIAGAMIAMCLITMCAISTTLAKYTTGSSAADTARVARWGVEVSASGTMFGTAYQDTIIEDGNDAATVQSNHNASFAANVVAPGTKNDTGIKISVKGNPEVAYKIQAKQEQAPKDIFLAKGSYGVMVAAPGVNAATDFAGEKIYYLDNGTYKTADLAYYLDHTTVAYYKLTDEATVADAFYYPIKWTASVSVNDTFFPQNPAFATLGAALDALINGINDYDNDPATVGYAQFDPNTSINLVYSLTWAWAFEDQNDGADTILGNLMANTQGHSVNVVKLSTDGYVAVESADYSLEVGCGFSITATQVD
jgi:hypothetical protein